MTDKKNWIKSSQRPTKKEVEEIVNDLDGTEKENTWQTVYEQLQEILNKCIELWWRKWAMHKAFISCDITWIHFMSRDESVEKSEHMSYHDLFSKDIGIMECVEWRIWDVLDNYLEMADKTAEHKVYYFVKNAIIPTK